MDFSSDGGGLAKGGTAVPILDGPRFESDTLPAQHAYHAGIPVTSTKPALLGPAGKSAVDADAARSWGEIAWAAGGVLPGGGFDVTAILKSPQEPAPARLRPGP
jgi:hypothetical protein